MSESKRFETLFSEKKICVIIPAYNNAGTLAQVLHSVRQFTDNILVVNDGSTDNTLEILSKIQVLEIITYSKNQGKGFALKTAFRKAIELGFDYAITIDADGQHFAEDIPIFLENLTENPGTLIVGARNITAEGMPGKNTFANKFSNFWFWVETGQKLPDTQSGFRLYPINKYKNTKFFTKKYEFELEILVRSAWQEIPIESVPVRVYYPPENERVSHFRPLRDFTRISILNTFLVLIMFFYILPRKAFLYLVNNKLTTVVKEQLTAHNENKGKIASAIGFGIFMGLLPIWGFQMLVATFLAHLLKLNKILVLVAANISLPPLIPFIIYFSYSFGAYLLGSENTLNAESVSLLKSQIMSGNFYDTLVDFGYNFYQYVVGSIALATVSGLLAGVVTFVSLKIFQTEKIKTTS